MKKVTFKYKKSDGTENERTLLSPNFVKESYNKFSDFDNKNVNYIQGYEIQKDKLSEKEIKLYEEAIKDYFELALPTIEEFLSENNLDPKKIVYKTFKKEGTSDVKVL